ncbi:MAG: hypothetical protein K6G48_00420 [Acholeplasmatales bacterium]|nr:hypothetical protein [Acholeplasmatales bacterium]
MNKDLIFKYLGYRNVEPDPKTLKLIDECIEEVKSLASFKYIYQEYSEPLPFLLKNEAYMKYLSGASSYLLVATTLGIAVDRRLSLYEKTDMTKSVIFDCTASAYIEEMADMYEKTKLQYEKLSFRFCPGYSGTSFLDNQEAAKYLNVTKYLGINFLSSGLMVPLKSMIGIVAIGNNARKSCSGCVRMGKCEYRRDGTTCYKE